MNMTSKTEKNYGRIEKRTAYITDKIEWLEEKSEWSHLCCIGAIQRNSKRKKGNRMNGIIIFQAKI